nr:MAG TPA: DNA polymerase II small subunit [Caudoviricetes sp.]
MPGETDDQLIYRVTKDKDIIGSWNDVADVLNQLLGTHYGESKFRKDKATFDRMLNANRDMFVDSDKQLQDIRIAQRELEKTRKKIQTEKLEYSKWLREDARAEMVTEKICNAVRELKTLDIPEYIPPIHDHKSYLLCLADAHYGIEFEIKDLFGNIINEYSPEIFETRMWNLLNKVVQLVNKEHITELNVWELGDGLQGVLRLNSQLMKLRYGIIDSSILYANFLANWLNELSKYVRIKFQMVIDSNHNQLRICGAPKNAFVDENMSKSMLVLIKERLKGNKNIVILENPTGMDYSVLSTYAVLGIHGEVPNIKTAIDEYARAYQTHFDYLIGAHCHHKMNVEVGIDAECLTVRSIIGVDPYGMSLRKTSNPGASLFEFELGQGLTTQHSIKLN